MNGKNQDHRHSHEPGGAARWRELVECCRPGSDDAFQPALVELAPLADQLVADPAVQELYERTQHADATVREAMLDVPVPSDLAARLLAAISEASIEAESAEPPVVEVQRREGVRRSRYWWLGAALTAAALVIGVAAFLVISSKTPITGADVAARSGDWLAGLRSTPEAWNADLSAAPLETLPIDRQLASKAKRWRTADNEFGKGAVYDLRRRQQDPLAVVYVLNPSRRLDQLPSSPPVAKPQLQTHGYVTGVWARSPVTRDGKLLYVLIVEGSHERFKEFVRRPNLASASKRNGRAGNVLYVARQRAS